MFPHTTTGAAARLIRMFNVPVSEYLRFTQRYNAYHDGEREITDLAEARRRMQAIHFHHVDVNPDVHFLYLGKAAVNAAPKEYRRLEFLQNRGNVWLIPHPSGVNRIYNDELYVERTSELLKSIWRRSRVTQGSLS